MHSLRSAHMQQTITFPDRAWCNLAPPARTSPLPPGEKARLESASFRRWSPRLVAQAGLTAAPALALGIEHSFAEGTRRQFRRTDLRPDLHAELEVLSGTVRAGCDTRPGIWRSPGSPSWAAGSRHAACAAAICAFTAMAGIFRDCSGSPGTAGMAWRDWRWRAASASSVQPLVPTGAHDPFESFRIRSPTRAPLWNRTVDLLLSMHASFV